MDIRALRLALKKDPVFERLESLYLTASKFDFDKVEVEISGLHASRPSRSLLSRGVTPSTLNRATATDVSNRSRLIEIRASCYRSKIILETAVRSARIHLRSMYGDTLKALFGSTKAEVDAGIDKLISKYIKLLSMLECMLVVIEDYIRDIDQTRYALRDLIDIAKLTLGAGSRAEVL
jgi:hypothetical protein